MAGELVVLRGERNAPSEEEEEEQEQEEEDGPW